MSDKPKILGLDGKPIIMETEDILTHASNFCKDKNVIPHIVIGMSEHNGEPVLMSNLSDEGQKILIDIVHRQQNEGGRKNPKKT